MGLEQVKHGSKFWWASHSREDVAQTPPPIVSLGFKMWRRAQREQLQLTLADKSFSWDFFLVLLYLATCPLHSLLFHLETQHNGVRSIQEVQSWAADCVWVPLKGGSEDMSHMKSKTCTFCEVGDSNVNVNESLKRILTTWFLDGSRPISSVSVR